MPKREYRACCAPIRWQKAASIEGAVISGLQAGKGTGALFGGDRETIGPVHLRNLADIDEKQISVICAQPPQLSTLRLVLPPVAIKSTGEDKWGNKGENNVDDKKTYHKGHDAKNDSDSGVRTKYGQLKDFLEGF
jgi:hypothetical protein